jgi:hypothetical protein
MRLSVVRPLATTFFVLQLLIFLVFRCIFAAPLLNGVPGQSSSGSRESLQKHSKDADTAAARNTLDELGFTFHRCIQSLRRRELMNALRAAGRELSTAATDLAIAA